MGTITVNQTVPDVTGPRFRTGQLLTTLNINHKNYYYYYYYYYYNVSFG